MLLAQDRRLKRENSYLSFSFDAIVLTHAKSRNWRLSYILSLFLLITWVNHWIFVDIRKHYSIYCIAKKYTQYTSWYKSAHCLKIISKSLKAWFYSCIEIQCRQTVYRFRVLLFFSRNTFVFIHTWTIKTKCC